MSVQTGEAVPSGPVSQRLGDRARYRFAIWRTDPNPIWVRELKQAVRLQRTPVILCVLTMIMTMLIAGIGGIATAENSPSTTGIILFHVYFSVAYFIVTLVGPTVAANGIAAEREGRTWEAVLLAGLEPGMIARGKFLAAYTTISLYIVMLAPVGALPFLFGGVTATETVVAFLFLFLIALMSVAFGLAVSSKMTSMRGAIAVTLLLALVFSMASFGLFGPGLSVVAHDAWPNVPDGPPIWLPTAYSRAPFGAEYVLALFVGPVVAISIPAWFMYEVSIASLTDATDDRSSGLKRWFLISIPVLTAVGIAPIAGGDTAKHTAVFAMLSQGVFFLVLMFCVFLFQGDAIGPSRRITSHWDRAKVGRFARWMGPGVTRTATLQIVLGVLGFAVLTAVGVALVKAHGLSSLAYATYSYDSAFENAVLLFGLYSSGFFVFMLGLGTLSRTRSRGSMVARLVLAGAVLALVITPWVIAAIVGVLGAPGAWDDNLLAIASPSPAYLFYAISRIDRTDPGNAPMAAAICGVGYWLLGVVFLMSARRRSDAIILKHNAMMAETDRLLAQEDAAAEAARAQAEEAAVRAAEAGAVTPSLSADAPAPPAEAGAVTPSLSADAPAATPSPPADAPAATDAAPEPEPEPSA